MGGWLLSLSKTASQSGDHAAAAVALQPAWEALEANLHKAPLSPAQPGGPHVASSGSAAAAQQQQQQAGCPFLLRFTAAWVYVAMATAGVSLYEKQKRYEEACDTIRKLLGEAQDSLMDLERGRPKTQIYCSETTAPRFRRAHTEKNGDHWKVCLAMVCADAAQYNVSWPSRVLVSLRCIHRMWSDPTVSMAGKVATGKQAGMVCAQEGCAAPTGGANGGCGCPSIPSTWAAQRWRWRCASLHLCLDHI